jgi:DNA-binding ferritin-like protein
MGRPKKYSPEFRERAVRMVQEHTAEYPSQWAAIESIATKLGCTGETLRKWVQISRLLHAHDTVFKEARAMARVAAERDDHGTNDLLVSDVIRINEIQVWFVAEHVVDTPVVRAD